MTGRLIAFEGGEACGKSTQAARLAHALGAVLTREPGGTAVGERVREILLDRGVEGLDVRAETLLMLAARAQHVAEVISPARADGRDVVTDRFTGSTLAYQGYGRGLDLDGLRSLSSWATGGLWPGVTVLLEIPAETALARRGVPDRFEAESAEFHQRVAEGYRMLASADPTWIVVDGSGSVDEVEARVRKAVEARLR